MIYQAALFFNTIFFKKKKERKKAILDVMFKNSQTFTYNKSIHALVSGIYYWKLRKQRMTIRNTILTGYQNIKLK